MTEYRVVITELSKAEVKVKAKDSTEAISLALDKVESGELELKQGTMHYEAILKGDI